MIFISVFLRSGLHPCLFISPSHRHISPYVFLSFFLSFFNECFTAGNFECLLTLACVIGVTSESQMCQVSHIKGQGHREGNHVQCGRVSSVARSPTLKSTLCYRCHKSGIPLAVMGAVRPYDTREPG